MWNGTIFVDLDWPLNASSLLSASAELLVHFLRKTCQCARWERPLLFDKNTDRPAQQENRGFGFHSIWKTADFGFASVTVPSLLFDIKSCKCVDIESHTSSKDKKVPIEDREFLKWPTKCMNKMTNSKTDVQKTKSLQWKVERLQKLSSLQDRQKTENEPCTSKMRSKLH